MRTQVVRQLSLRRMRKYEEEQHLVFICYGLLYICANHSGFGAGPIGSGHEGCEKSRLDLEMHRVVGHWEGFVAVYLWQLAQRVGPCRCKLAINANNPVTALWLPYRLFHLQRFAASTVVSV